VVANGSRPTSAASAKSVRRLLRSSAVPASSPTPASAKRMPAPKNGSMSSSPTAMTGGRGSYLDQTSTQAA
jgi:hypothetical protein